MEHLVVKKLKFRNNLHNIHLEDGLLYFTVCKIILTHELIVYALKFAHESIGHRYFPE